MPQITINGTPVEYAEQGSGEPLLFVHGSTSDYRTWAAQQTALSHRFRTLAYSRRYHWPNDPIPPDTDYAMQQQVDDLGAFIQTLDLAPVDLVGHSYGAFLGLLLAIQAPALVHSLVLVEPPVVTLFIDDPPQPQQLLRLLLTRPRTAFAVIRLAATGLNPAGEALKRKEPDTAIRLLGEATLGSDTFAALSAERMAQVKANLIPAELLGSGFLPLDDDAVRQVQTPVLLLNGAHSPAVFHRLNDRLAALLPHVERVTIPRASHISQEDNPSAFNAALLSFLENQR